MLGRKRETLEESKARREASLPKVKLLHQLQVSAAAALHEEEFWNNNTKRLLSRIAPFILPPGYYAVLQRLRDITSRGSLNLFQL